jgi:HlyD family secretion protein
MKENANRSWIWILGILVIAAVVIAFLALPRMLAPAEAAVAQNYQTVKVERGNVSDYVSATGKVRSNQTATLVWQTNGIVEKVNFSKGQVVNAKSILAELEQTSLSQAIIMAQADLVTAQKALDDLLNTNLARANAGLAVVKAEQTLDDRKKDRDSKQYQRASQQTIDIARANLIQAKDALDKAETNYDKNKNRNQDDLVYAAALSMLATAQQRYDRADYNYRYVSGLPDALDIQEADALVEQAEAQVLSAKREWERVKDGPNDQDVVAAEARVAGIQATINLAHISAPFTGTLTVVNSKVGDQITPGMVAIQIDDLTHLYVDVDVSEQDIDRVSLGQAVSMTLETSSGAEIQGTITDIAPVGRTVSGTVYFTVTVEITDPGDAVHPGMTAQAKILTNQLQGVLLVPNRAIQTLNGKRVVYLLKNGRPAPVEVALGVVTNTQTEIVAGAVKEGDLLVLNPAESIGSQP